MACVMVYNIVGAESFRRVLIEARCAAKPVVSAIRRSTPSFSNSQQHKYIIMVLTGSAALFQEVDNCYVSECNLVRGLARQRGVDSWYPRNLVSVRRIIKWDLVSEVNFQNSPLTFLSTSVVSEIDNFASSTGNLYFDSLVHMKKFKTMRSLKTTETLTTRSTWLALRAWTACRLTTSGV